MLNVKISIDQDSYDARIKFINGVKFVVEDVVNMESDTFNSFQRKLFHDKKQDLDQTTTYYTLIFTKPKTFKIAAKLASENSNFDLYHYQNVSYIYIKVKKEEFLDLNVLENLHSHKILRYKVFNYNEKTKKKDNTSSLKSDFNRIRKQLGFLTIDEQIELKRNKEK